MKVMYRVFLGLTLGFLAACGYLAALGSSTTAPVKGDGADTVSSTTTGIYRIATYSPVTGKRYEALMLSRKGKAVEVHSRKSATTYLKRGSGSSATKLSISKFDQLLQIAAVNVDVERLPATARQQYYQIAGFATTGSSMPMQVNPGSNGQCPTGYELKLIMKDGRKQTVCQIMSQSKPQPEEQKWASNLGLLSRAAHGFEVATTRGMNLWNRLRILPSVEASLAYFRFQLSNLFSDVTFTYDPGAGYGGQTQISGWSFSGFGMTIMWVDDQP